MNLNIKGLSVFLASGLWALSASAMPVNSTLSLDAFRNSSSFSDVAAVNFEGIVALSNCSGSIVRYESSRDDDQAMVLTNGHCYEGGFINAGTFVLNADSTR